MILDKLILKNIVQVVWELKTFSIFFFWKNIFFRKFLLKVSGQIGNFSENIILRVTFRCYIRFKHARATYGGRLPFNKPHQCMNVTMYQRSLHCRSHMYNRNVYSVMILISAKPNFFKNVVGTSSKLISYLQ
jgi:hypothetical protein